MKPLTFIFLVASLALCAKAASLADVFIMDEEDDDDNRDKRALGFIANKIGNKFASKFGYHEGPPPIPPPQHELEYGPPISYHSKHFDIWGFKKAIFNALFQAVKAIKGGIIAFKGQILKAKGHILATKGNILAAKGDAITNFGRQLAAKSLLEPEVLYEGPLEGPIPLDHSGYAASTTSLKESAPPPLPTKSTVPEYKPPEPTYEAPPSTSNGYGLFKEEPKAPPKDYGAGGQGGLPGGVQAGLLVLKPFNIPSSGGGGGGGQFAEPPGSYSAPQFGGGPSQLQFGGGSSQLQFGGGPSQYNGYAGPLSPSAYDSFGGQGDLSASFSQSAVQSNQRKRASPVPRLAPQQRQFQRRPQIFYQNPNYAYRQ